MKETITQKAEKIIMQKRLEAEKFASQNLKKAFENADFKKAYETYIDDMLASHGQEKLTLKQVWQSKLKQLHLGSISPIYFCEKCKDTGRLDGQVCNCLKKEINNLLIEESGFKNLESFAEANFNLFDKKEEMKKKYALMEKWCNSKFNKTLIYLSGQTGTGKTHLAKCMAKKLIDNGHFVNFTTAYAMNEDFIKSHFCYDNNEKQALLEKYFEPEILFVDDLGTEVIRKDITTSYLYLLLNERKTKHLSTIITTNLDLKNIRDKYDERISSRIIDTENSICIYIDDTDVRLKKLLNK